MSKFLRGMPLVAALLSASASGQPAAALLNARVPAAQSLPPLSAGTIAFRIVDAHNRYRLPLGLRPLVWDRGLEAGAAAHAAYLSSTGTFAHSNRRARRGIGENLWTGSRRAFAIEQMVAMWGSEGRMFVPGIFPAVSRNGNWMAVAHYTQIIWPTTTHVGCALASGRGRDVLVCRYAPAGNIDGRRVP
jgi:hypothetical protein